MDTVFLLSNSYSLPTSGDGEKTLGNRVSDLLTGKVRFETSSLVDRNSVSDRSDELFLGFGILVSRVTQWQTMQTSATLLRRCQLCRNLLLFVKNVDKLNLTWL